MTESLRCPECGNTRIKACYLVGTQSYDIQCFRCGDIVISEEDLARIMKFKTYGYKTRKLSNPDQNEVVKKVASMEDDYILPRLRLYK